MATIDYAFLGLTCGDASLDLLAADERSRAARYVREADRLRFVRGRRALRVELAQRLQAAPGAIALTYGPQGKPRLAPPFDASGITFSVAHSGELALLAFADRCDIGVDLERLRDAPHADAIARRLFPHAGAGLDSEAFFRAWTRHEARLKCLGGSVLAPSPPATSVEFAIAEIPAPAGYVAAACARDASLTLMHRPLYSAG